MKIKVKKKLKCHCLDILQTSHLSTQSAGCSLPRELNGDSHCILNTLGIFQFLIKADLTTAYAILNL